MRGDDWSPARSRQPSRAHSKSTPAFGGSVRRAGTLRFSHAILIDGEFRAPRVVRLLHVRPRPRVDDVRSGRGGGIERHIIVPTVVADVGNAEPAVGIAVRKLGRVRVVRQEKLFLRLLNAEQ